MGGALRSRGSSCPCIHGLGIEPLSLRIAHYTIGVVFALVFVVFASGDWLARPTLLPALLYGIGTVVFPFFIMQPSLGIGIAASRTPNPTQARLKSLVTHTVFGLGLYVCALGVSYLLRAHA
ncbi:MAG TPA: DUF2938 family protein [Thermoanaerobaculia bacterium]|nr:DUF2938 family protein [Thermoanaerobaculia bacterium]